MMARLGTLVACLGLAMGLGGRCEWLLVQKMQKVGRDELLGVEVVVGPRVARWDWVPQCR